MVWYENHVLGIGALQVDRMFIDATQLTQNRAPSDASSVAFQVAIKQQKEFEEALKRAQDRREAEAAAERAQAEAQKEAARVEAVAPEDNKSGSLDSGIGGNSAEAPNNTDARGVTVDVEV